MNLNVSIIGLGFVGGAMLKSFTEKKVNVVGYDKYKDGGIGSLKECLNTKIAFLALPTPYDSKEKCYNKKAILSVVKELNQNDYKGCIVLKSTVEPGTTQELFELYPKLNIIHNPEFLTARTAYEDFHNQSHIVLGKGPGCSQEKIDDAFHFFSKYYNTADISVCTATESELMKIGVNCFYAAKVQFFTEMYLACEKSKINYNVVKNLMLKNGWINKMHTTVPGPDGNISYGGLCFPKDTNSYNHFLKRLNTPHKVIEAVITERNEMREDHDNCH